MALVVGNYGLFCFWKVTRAPNLILDSGTHFLIAARTGGSKASACSHMTSRIGATASEIVSPSTRPYWTKNGDPT